MQKVEKIDKDYDSCPSADKCNLLKSVLLLELSEPLMIEEENL